MTATYDPILRRRLLDNLDKPWHGDIYSARLLVQMADQDGEEIEPEIRALAAIRLDNDDDETYVMQIGKKKGRPPGYVSPVLGGVIGGVIGVLAALVLTLLGVW